VFRRQPTLFCPSAALPDPGSYLARDAAGTALLAVRGRDGRVRVFRNACRHRGVQVAEGEGCRTAFVCPYHQWVYGLDGCLRSARLDIFVRRFQLSRKEASRPRGHWKSQLDAISRIGSRALSGTENATCDPPPQRRHGN